MTGGCLIVYMAELLRAISHVPLPMERVDSGSALMYNLCNGLAFGFIGSYILGLS